MYQLKKIQIVGGTAAMGMPDVTHHFIITLSRC